MTPVRWSPRASANLKSIFKFIATDSEHAAFQQARLLVAATRRLESFPQSGRPIGVAGIRELPVPGTPYVIRYKVSKDIVRLVSIVHGARNESRR